MPFDNLPDFLARLQDDGECVRVSTEVDPHLEITEIVDRVCKQPGGGPCLVFEKVRGSPLPLVVNLLGRSSRILTALDARGWDEPLARVHGARRSETTEGWFQKLKQVGGNAQVDPSRPQVIKTGLCQQVVRVGRDIDLRELPALHAWPGDAGRCLHGGVVLTRHPTLQTRHIETIPLRILDRDSLSVHWHDYHAARQLLDWHRAQGTHLPIAIAFGGDPVWQLLAKSPVSPHLDPLGVGGCLRGKSIEIVRGRQVELDVPAGAELVLEGYIDARETPTESGAWATNAGTYALSADVPIMHVTTLTHRGNPMLVQNVPGRPPMEDDALWDWYARMALPLLRESLPELYDLRMLHQVANDRICFVSVQKTHARQARKVLHALWGHPATMFCKLIVVVDAEVPLEQSAEVWQAVANHLDPARDVILGEGPAAPIDLNSGTHLMGSMVGLDATRKLPSEGQHAAAQIPVTMTEAVRELVTQRWQDYRIERQHHR